jgi:hypothetical protein
MPWPGKVTPNRLGTPCGRKTVVLCCRRISEYLQMRHGIILLITLFALAGCQGLGSLPVKNVVTQFPAPGSSCAGRSDSQCIGYQ